VVATLASCEIKGILKVRCNSRLFAFKWKSRIAHGEPTGTWEGKYGS